MISNKQLFKNLMEKVKIYKLVKPIFWLKMGKLIFQQLYQFIFCYYFNI